MLTYRVPGTNIKEKTRFECRPVDAASYLEEVVKITWFAGEGEDQRRYASTVALIVRWDLWGPPELYTTWVVLLRPDQRPQKHQPFIVRRFRTLRQARRFALKAVDRQERRRIKRMLEVTVRKREKGRCRDGNR